MRPVFYFAFLLFGPLSVACDSTETGNPHRPQGPSGPTLRSVPLRLAIHLDAGSAGPSESGLSGLELELTEIEVLNCDDESVVISFEQQGSWGSEEEEEAQLPDGASCRVIVRGAPLELSVTADASAGAFIEGSTDAGPFKLLAPAPIAAFLQVANSDTDLTSAGDLRLEVSEERLMSDIERLLALPGKGLLEPGSAAAYELSRALESALDLVAGQGEQRRLLASGRDGANLFLCEDYCRASERTGCGAQCAVSACQEAVADPNCGALHRAWMSCLTRIPTDQLACDAPPVPVSALPSEAASLSDSDDLCEPSRSASELCWGDAGQ